MKPEASPGHKRSSGIIKEAHNNKSSSATRMWNPLYQDIREHAWGEPFNKKRLVWSVAFNLRGETLFQRKHWRGVCFILQKRLIKIQGNRHQWGSWS